MKVLAENKKAFFDFEILETFVAGISLLGTEVKSLKNHKINLRGSLVIIKGREAFWVGAKIPPWQPSNTPSFYKEDRERKLLLTKKELKYLLGKVKQKGLTLIPLKLYNKGRWIKLEFGIARKKKKFEKKEKEKGREIKEEIEKIFKKFK